MPPITNVPVRYIRGVNVHAWQWQSTGGTLHQIAWLVGSRGLLYGIRAPGSGRWVIVAMDPDRWEVTGGTLAAARHRVTEFLAACGRNGS